MPIFSSRDVTLLLTAVLITVMLKGQPAAAAPVFQTGQDVEVREGDSWSKASILKREGRKYFIHYAGSDSSTDEWVGPDRVRAAAGTATPKADAGDLPTATGDTGPAAAPNRSHVSADRHHPSDDANAPTEVIPQTKADRTAVMMIHRPNDKIGWSVTPDPAARTAAATRSFPIPQPEDKHVEVKQLLPVANGGAIITFSTWNEKSRMMARVGGSGAGSVYPLPADCLPLCASPTGSVLVCRGKKFGFGNNGRIDAFTIAGDGSPQPLVSFTPYPADSNNGWPDDIAGAIAVSDHRIITCNAKGQIIAWDIAPGEARGVWRWDVDAMHVTPWGGCDMDLSPGGKWVAAASQIGLSVIDVQSGQILGVAPFGGAAGLYDLDISPSGGTISARSDQSISTFDVATGKPRRTVAGPENFFIDPVLVDEDFAVIGGDKLIDLNTGQLINGFQSPLEGAKLAASAGGMTLLASNSKLVNVTMPDAATRSAALAAEDSALALKPGVAVALDMNLEMSDSEKTEVESAIRQKLKDDGFVLAGSSPIVISCRTEPGPQHEYAYGKSQFGMPVFLGSGTQTMILTSKITRLTIAENGQTIWERKNISVPAGQFKLKDGQSVEDGARETIKYSPQFLMNLEIPAYIARQDAGAAPVTPRRSRQR